MIERKEKILVLDEYQDGTCETRPITASEVVARNELVLDTSRAHGKAAQKALNEEIARDHKAYLQNARTGEAVPVKAAESEPATTTHRWDQAPKGARKNWMRNKPCPCGSGKKFKKCCWSDSVS